jgi:hypothetical protein
VHFEAFLRPGTEQLGQRLAELCFALASNSTLGRRDLFYCSIKIYFRIESAILNEWWTKRDYLRASGGNMAAALD